MTARGLVVWVTLAVALAMAAPAAAAAIPFTLQFGPSTDGQFALDGDTVSSFTVTLQPQTCATGNPSDSSDSRWTATLGAPATLSGGSFSFSGQATSAYYTGSGSVTVTGQVTPDHRIVTGTISLTNASDVFLSGCSGSYPFIAIPTTKYSNNWGVPRNRDFSSQFVSFDYRGGAVRSLVAQLNFACGAGIDEAAFHATDYGFPVIRASAGGAFAVHTYVLDEYGDIVKLDLTGAVGPTKASGRIAISEPPGLTGVSGERCSGNYAWTASRPRPPAPPRPEAFFEWHAVRVPEGAGYRYYFYIAGLTCQHGASAVELTVGARRTQISCSSGQGWASGPLSPGRTYLSSAQAVELRRGRITRRGVLVAEPLQMPGAGDSWRPISGLRGGPPPS